MSGFATWVFDGFDTPALNERTDPKPPRLRGAIHLVTITVTPSPIPVFPPPPPDVEVVVADAAETERVRVFYFDQGITARDVEKMTAADALARVPVATLRARTFADVPTDPGARGTVTALTGPPRTVDNDVIPSGL
jgi:hypothetical protein